MNSPQYNIAIKLKNINDKRLIREALAPILYNFNPSKIPIITPTKIIKGRANESTNKYFDSDAKYKLNSDNDKKPIPLNKRPNPNTEVIYSFLDFSLSVFEIKRDAVELRLKPIIPSEKKQIAIANT